MTTEQVKYFTDNGEILVPAYAEAGADAEPQDLHLEKHLYSPWPPIVLVLGSFSILVLCILGIVWILHG